MYLGRKLIKFAFAYSSFLSEVVRRLRGRCCLVVSQSVSQSVSKQLGLNVSSYSISTPEQP